MTYGGTDDIVGVTLTITVLSQDIFAWQECANKHVREPLYGLCFTLCRQR